MKGRSWAYILYICKQMRIAIEALDILLSAVFSANLNNLFTVE